jgi:hypothetical protein
MDPRSRRTPFAALLLATLAAAGCASLGVNSYLERGFDVRQYHTYAWAPVDQLSTGDPRLDNNPFFMDRVQAAVDRELAALGFEKITTGTPELVLHYHASITQRLDVSGMDQKYGTCEECTPYVFDAGTLTIDFVDGRTDRLVWRGWAEGSIAGAIDNQRWMERRVDEAVARILKRLPRRL